MMRCTIQHLILAVFLLTGPAAHAQSRHVVLLSVDGLKSDAVARLDQQRYPNFYRLKREGAHTLNARTDVDFTVTVPNHLCMLTGKPVKGPRGHHVTVNNEGPYDVHQFSDHYVASVFDVLRSAGLTSAVNVSKLKFEMLNSSYPIDEFNANNLGDVASTALTLTQLRRFLPPAFIFLHLSGMDITGHHQGFDAQADSAYMKELMSIDVYLGFVMDEIARQIAHGNTVTLIVTTDHGGIGLDHQTATDKNNYTIPFFVWGSGVEQRFDLYRLNRGSRRDPQRRRPDYNEPQPIRNGDAANLALHLLGLKCVPGSSIGCEAPLKIHR